MMKTILSVNMRNFALHSALLLIFILVSSCSVTSPSRNRGIWYELKPGDTLKKVSERFAVEQMILQEENEIYDPGDLATGMRIFIPGVRSIETFSSPSSKAEPSTHKLVMKVPDVDNNVTLQPKNRYASRSVNMIWPSPGIISSGYGKRHGRMHQGIDLTRDGGLDIKSAASGRVVFAGYKTGYGKCIIIDHGGKLKTLYGHNRTIYVRKGQKVRQGAIIAKMGKTGRVTGIHLHFEVQLNGKHQNPLRYLPTR